ncbi:efflux RND transporter periplasmic adaptor subunit [Sphingomonas morindae]|uniref:Efflux RND transporter periplasmic adaptor subunit n=1 Tax=Sphingomonas morindae TaxID=1541170 RepID=A0ABY4XB93_9SPHN|nr:efflux RND transporter periplasmic adaptor subunit [Sphingomonas morindae]USI74183.1 efflux RND transporter periplasmic adaptor subunit [Sphingomonas morindae]
MTEPIAPPADQDIDSFLGVERPTRRRRIARRLAIGVALVLVLLFVVRCAFGTREPEHYATAPARRADLTVSVAATGNLTPTRQVNVGSEVSGIVTQVFVQNNDHVAKGQPLARLDTARLEDALRLSIAQLRAAEAAVAQNQATLDQSAATYRRYQEVARLSGGKVPSKTELDTARADFERAQANLAAARAQVDQNQATVSSNRTNLAKATIYSPVDGVVLSRQVEPGQTVAAQFNVATLFTIAEDLAAMKLDVKVDEADVGEVHAGDPANFTVDAYPGRVFPARVERIDFGANATPTVNSAGSSTSNATTAVVAYTASLSVANPDLALRPGMTASATIITAVRRNVLLVPNAALRFRPRDQAESGGFLLGGPKDGSGGFGQAGQDKSGAIGRGSRQAVFVLRKGKPVAVPVVVGDSNGSLTAVSGAGLRPGVAVITGTLAHAAS